MFIATVETIHRVVTSTLEVGKERDKKEHEVYGRILIETDSTLHSLFTHNLFRG
jgi:hypothetical protein